MKSCVGRKVIAHQDFRVVGMTVGLATLAIQGCGSGDPTPVIPPTAVTVQIAVAQLRAPLVTLTGAIAARVQGDLGFRLSGRISKRLVDVGDHIEAGQSMAELENVQQKADITSAEAGVESAVATVNKVETDFRRQKDLLTKGFTKRSTHDDAQEALTSARAALEGAKAALGIARDRFEQTTLRATAAGIITARTAETGQVVAAAQSIFTVARDGDRDAVFDVYEGLMSRKPTDGTVEIKLLSDPSISAVGRTREISPVVDAATNTVRVKVGIANSPPQMTLGAPVSGIGRFQPRKLFALPSTAFFVDQSRPAVWILDPQTKAVSLRPIVVASYQTNEILVSDGLEAGDFIVTSGGQFLWPGKIVVPLESAPPGVEGEK